MIQKAQTWQKGYLKLKIRGCERERFLNMCLRLEISVWDIQMKSEENEKPDLICCMKLHDFYRIRPIVRKTKVRVRIIGKSGLPFFFFQNRRRWALLAGPVMAGGMLLWLSLFVWNIEFEGNSRYTDDYLMSYLKENGIVPGTLKDQVLLSSLEEQIRLDFPEILWVSAEISGTRLSIKVRENDAVFSIPEVLDRPANLVSMADATITKMVIRQGKNLVKEKETVKKGQLLVEGKLELKNDDGEVFRESYVRAEGEIYGFVWHRYRKQLDSCQKIQVKTGRKKKEIFLTTPNHSWYLGMPSRRASLWIASGETRQMKVGRDFYLPVWYGTVQKEEIQIFERPYTQKEAEEAAQQEKKVLEEKLLEKGVHIIENNVKIQENGLSFSIEIEMLCEEQIAVWQPIAEPENSRTEDS